MRIAVIVGIDLETGKSEALCTGTPGDMRAELRAFKSGKKCKFSHIRMFEQEYQRVNLKQKAKKPKVKPDGQD